MEAYEAQENEKFGIIAETGQETSSYPWFVVQFCKQPYFVEILRRTEEQNEGAFSAPSNMAPIIINLWSSPAYFQHDH